MARNVTEAERESGRDRVARVAAAALDLLRAGDAAGCDALIERELPNSMHFAAARAKVRDACMALRGGSSCRSSVGRLGPDIRSLFLSRGHGPVAVSGDLAICTRCGRQARVVKLWGRWCAVGPAERERDLTDGGPCRRAA